MHPVLFHIGPLLIPSYGAVAALGVLLALALVLYMARKLHLDPNRIWNLSVIMLFTSLAGARLLLVIANWTALRHHPLWMLSLAMVHHPLVGAIEILLALAVGGAYVLLRQMPWRTTADALAAPTALGLGFEQVGALLAGSGYGTGTHVPWAVTYTDPLAARWSDVPLGIPVHPVQAYAALCSFAIALAIAWWLPRRRQNGDLAGIFLMATGATMFITEFWRDPLGRGALFRGMLKAPQLAGIILVLTGAFLLLERKSERIVVEPYPVHDPRPAPPPVVQSPTHD